MIKKIKYILFMILLVVILAYGSSYARITTNDPSVNSGETVTITINSQEPVASGAVNISSNSGLTFVKAEGGTVNGTLVAFAGTDNKTSNIAKYTFTAPTVNTDTTYKVVFASKDMSDKDGNSVSDSTATATVTVKAKQTTPTPDPEPTPTPEPEKPTEPTFTDTNKTMYSTGNINLRASWSTSSNATSIEKGTELNVTGTSKEKVNGYVWYRVSYNGQTKYVASSLLTSTKPEEETKSNNANLKSLVVENYNIIPEFSSDVTNYTLDITKDVNELEIKAEPEDSKATVTIKGEKELKEGENTVIISVDAEDGTTKLYEIKVTKKEEIVFGLASLKIKDVNIEFKPDVYNYSINIKSNIDILEIQAVASEEDATVEITGNEKLKEGENIITIIVSSKDGEKKATYQIKATKEAKEEITPRKTQSNSKIYIYAGIGAVVLIALIIVIVYTVKHRKEDEDDSEKFEGFPDELPEKEDNEEENDNEKTNIQLEEKIDNQENQKEINSSEEEKYVDLKDKKDNKSEQEEIDRKNYFLDTQSEDDYEKPRKRKGKHF